MGIASVLPLAFGIGLVTGLRSMVGPAAVAWGARLGWLGLKGTAFAFLAYPLATAILTLAALGELVVDKLPKTPSRKAPGPFGVRVVFGGLCGIALALGYGAAGCAGLVGGVAGAVAGTLGGYAYRVWCVRTIQGPDWLFAAVEDLLAVGLALLVISRHAS